MGTIDLLHGASFKGSRFLARGAVTTAGGRKLIDHIYPNSERRFIEDLGKKQRDFTITGIIQGPNYFAKRNLLMKSLESEGSGRFVHPFFGSIIVNARPYSLTEDLTSVNTGTFTMSFSVPSKNIFPTNRGITNISSFVDSIRSSIDDLLATDFSMDFSESLLAAENVMNDVFDKFDDMSRGYAQVSDNLTTFKKIISDGRNKISQIIRSPTLLGEFLREIFEAANNLFLGITESSAIILTSNIINTIFLDPTDPAQTLSASRDQQTSNSSIATFGALNTLFGFQGGDNTKLATTKIIENENENNNVVNVAVNVLALSNAYLNANLIQYGNDQNLLTVLDLLEEQFAFITNDLIIDDPVLSDLFTIRDQFRQFSDNLLIKLDRVITVNTEKIPVAVLAYQYYGSTSNYENIIRLNKILNPSEVSGDVKILTR